MRSVHLLLAALVVLCMKQAVATNIPTEPLAPIGCATTHLVPGDSLPPGDTLDVEIVTNRQWGVVPFEADLDVVLSEGSDSILGITWDFDADSLADASGAPVSHVFSDPIDHEVTADVITLRHGTLRESTTISGHSAMMTLTFDDGQASVLEVAFPLLAGRGITATAYVVPTWVGWGWYMSWDGLHVLEDFGWDIGSHGLTHVDLTKVDSLTLHHELGQSRAELQARGFAAKHFAPPFGACNRTVIDATRQYYESCRNWRGLNPRVEDADPYEIRWEVTSQNKPLAEYKRMMDSVMTYGGWLVLNSHIVDQTCEGLPTCVRIEMLVDIIDYALASRIKILNVEDVLSSMQAAIPAEDPPAPLAAPSAHGCRLRLDGVPVSSFPVTIAFATPHTTGAELNVYDVCGRLVNHLAHVTGGAGEYLAVWNGENLRGAPIADGCYLCVLRMDEGKFLTRKIVVAR